MARVLAFFVLLILLVPVGALLALNGGLFQSRIEAEAMRLAAAPVHLGPVRVLYRWPPRLRIGATVIDHPLAVIQWRALQIQLFQWPSPWGVEAHLDEPKVQLRAPKLESATTAPHPVPTGGEAASKAAASDTPIHLRLKIVNGEVISPMAHISGINLGFEQSHLLKSKAALHLNAMVKTKFLPIGLPLRVDTDDLQASTDQIKMGQGFVSLGGLQAGLQGTSLLRDDRHRWLVELKAPDLSLLPKPPMDLPASDWRGSMMLNAEIVKPSASQPWQAEGKVSAKQISVNLNYQQSGMVVTGPVLVNLDAKFQYFNEKPTVPLLNASFDATGAKIVYPEMLTKAAGVPLTGTIQAQGDQQDLKFEALKVKFWNLAVELKGQIRPQSPFPASLKVILQPAILAGAESVFPMLRSSPVQGQVAGEMAFDGDLSKAILGRAKVTNLKVHNLAAKIQLDKPGVYSFNGPFKASLNGGGSWAKGQLGAIHGAGIFDLTAMALSAGPFRKAAAQLFKGNFNLRQNAETVQVDSLSLESFLGQIQVKGTVKNLSAPQLNLDVQMRPLRLTELARALPEMRELIPAGSLDSQLKLKGALKTAQPWHEWPLAISGHVSLRIPEYKLSSAPTKPESSAPSGKKPPAAPPSTASASFLPDGVLTRQMNVAVRATLGRLIKDALVAQNVIADGRVKSGLFEGSVLVGKVFSGRVEVKSLKVPVLKLRPQITGNVQWLDVDITSALAFTKPEYKDFAAGKASGVAELASLLPAEQDFLPRLKAKGDFVLKPVTLNSVKVGEMVNELLKKAPVLKLQPVKVDPLKGELRAGFDLKEGLLKLTQVNGTDVDGSEIRMQGQVTLTDFTGDLSGTFHWAKPQVKGCLLEGNTDAKGRMKIPIRIQGDLMKPGVNLLSDMATKLAGRALQCEGKKLVERAKSEGKAKLEKELKKSLKGLFGN